MLNQSKYSSCISINSYKQRIGRRVNDIDSLKYNATHVVVGSWCFKCQQISELSKSTNDKSV